MNLQQHNELKIAELDPHFQELVKRWLEMLGECAFCFGPHDPFTSSHPGKDAFDVWITDASRSAAQQLALWQQGRDMNGAIVDKKKVVTRAKTGEDAPHCHRGAIDTVPVIAGKWLWKRLDLFDRMNAAARSLQIVCGADFFPPDNGHFEDPEWRTFPQNS